MGGVICAIMALAPAIIEIFKKFERIPPPHRPTPVTETLTIDERDQLRTKARERLGMNIDLFNFGITGQTRTG